MSESKITFDEELSADLFTDIELSTSVDNAVNSDCKDLWTHIYLLHSLILYSFHTKILNFLKQVPCLLALMNQSPRMIYQNGKVGV